MSRACAIDIAPHALRLVVWDNGDGPRSQSVALDPHLEAEARREAEVAALKELAQALGAKGPVHAVLDPRVVLERRVYVPVAPDSELPSLARFQSQRAFALPADELTVVWDVGPEEPEGLPMRLTAVRHVDLVPILELVLAAGLKPGRGVLPGEALAHAARAANANGPAVILRGDAHEIDLALIDEKGELVASRGVRLHSSNPTAVIGAVRRGLGALPSQPESLVLFETDPARLGALRQLGDAVEVPEGADPAVLLAVAGADPSFRHRPELDLRGNVVQRAKREQKIRWSALGVAVAVILLLCGLLVERQFAAGRARIAELETEREALAPAVERAKSLAAEIRTAKAWSERRGRELEVLLLLAETLPEDAAYLTRVRWKDEGELLLTGMAKDFATVAAFVNRLEQHPRVRRVTPEGIREPKEKGLRGVTFSARATLNPGGSP